MEASDAPPGNKTQLKTFSMTATRTSSCVMKFFYNMRGKDEGALNIYSVTTKGSTRQMSISGDGGDGWIKALVDLSIVVDPNVPFKVMFEGE